MYDMTGNCQKIEKLRIYHGFIFISGLHYALVNILIIHCILFF